MQNFSENHTCLVQDKVQPFSENYTCLVLDEVQPFSENYTCLVIDEVQSLQWTQAQVAIFPVVTFRRDEDVNLIEDHLVSLSADKIHDSAFVELLYNKIHVMKNKTLL